MRVVFLVFNATSIRGIYIHLVRIVRYLAKCGVLWDNTHNVCKSVLGFIHTLLQWVSMFHGERVRFSRTIFMRIIL